MPIMACLDSGVEEEGCDEMAVVFVRLVGPGGERSCWLNTASRPAAQLDLGDFTVAAPVSLVVLIVSIFRFSHRKRRSARKVHTSRQLRKKLRKKYYIFRTPD